MSKLVLGLFAFAVSFYLATSLYVKRDNAYVREGTGSFYPLVTVLDRGARLEQIETNGSWYKVQACKASRKAGSRRIVWWIKSLREKSLRK